MDSPYMPHHEILEACPACNSHRIVCVVGIDFDFCLDCIRVWERLPADEPYQVDGEPLPFRVPCDNCAFRGDSKERADRDAWLDLQRMLQAGGAFYCHKGVPFRALEDGLPIEGSRPFEFPRRTSTVDLAGATHAYQRYDTDRMRLCRGYLNAHIAPLVKRVFGSDERTAP